MRNILITGAAGNLGKAVVDKFLSLGDRVIAIVSPGKAHEIKATANLVVSEADLTDENAVKALITRLVADYHSIDAALMLVGGYAPGHVHETDGTLMRRMYALNFETAYFIARQAFDRMMQQPSGGSLIFVGARPALAPRDGKGSVAYALSKSLIFKFSDFLNAEGAAHHVLSSVIVPSTIDTPANRSAMPGADFSGWVKPEAIADVMAFAVSASAAPLRETVLKVYGKA